MGVLPVLTPAQAARWDQESAQRGIGLHTLMEAAGRGIASVVTARMARRLRGGTLVAAGPGNNGGDGWVIARALHALGLPVWVVSPHGPRSELCGQVAGLARADGVRELDPDGPWPAASLVIDAILGTGARGPLRSSITSLVARIDELGLPVVAVDGPTGLDLETGVSYDGLRAELTITFGGYRRGHLLARDEVGDLCVIDIGFCPPDAAWPSLFEVRDAARMVPPLAAASHKGGRGRVVVVGGDVGMAGAPRLAGRAAFAAGAGLVHLAVAQDSAAAVAATEPDLQVALCDLRTVSDSLRALLERADAVVIGPGLGRGSGKARFVAEVASATRAPLVIDADGLMAFAGAAAELRHLAADRPVVLTPHAGEFRALFPEDAGRTATDPWGAAAAAAGATGAVVLLKGVPTVVVYPGEPPVTVAAGNPGLATGGSGDTLSGIIATWMAQGNDVVQAAAAGAQALGDAADIAARRVTARSVRPMDVIEALPDVWRRWDLERREPALGIAPIRHELPAPLRI
ncbi:MAG: NAD(P)H-hydrate dehydratase [Gemmatimonadetes bacterium]|nr:NAD(P)H-hydrate dehydratase [Gemmatimonadota bacterium]